MPSPEEYDSMLRTALTACVASHDPANLHQLDNGGTYQTSGWFLSDARLAPVYDCMREKGWDARPTTVLMP